MSENQKSVPNAVDLMSTMVEAIKQQGEQFKSFVESQAEKQSVTEMVEAKTKEIQEKSEAEVKSVKEMFEGKTKELEAQLDEMRAKKSVNVSGATVVKQDASVLELKMYNNLLEYKVKNTYNEAEYKSIIGDYCDAVIQEQKTSKSVKEAFQQVKALHNVIDYSNGGFATSMPLYLGAVQQLREFSPLRDLASIQVGKERDGYVEIVKASGRAQPQSLADTSYTSSDSISVTRKDVKAILYAKVADISDHLLNFAENPQGLINIINDNLLGAIGQGIAEDYILGRTAQDNAKIEPFVPTLDNTFEKNSAIQYDVDVNKIGFVKSGSPSGITKNAIISVKSKLASVYRTNAVYYMNSNTRDAIFNITGADGHPIFANYQNGLSAPDTLNGHRIVIDENMPNIDTNTLPIAFVNLSRYYKIYDALFSNGGSGNGGLVEFMPKSGKSTVSNFIAKAFTTGFVNDPQAAVFIKIAA